MREQIEAMRLIWTGVVQLAPEPADKTLPLLDRWAERSGGWAYPGLGG